MLCLKNPKRREVDITIIPQSDTIIAVIVNSPVNITLLKDTTKLITVKSNCYVCK